MRMSNVDVPGVLEQAPVNDPHVVPPLPLSMHVTVAEPNGHVAAQTLPWAVWLQDAGHVPSIGKVAASGTELQAAWQMWKQSAVR